MITNGQAVIRRKSRVRHRIYRSIRCVEAVPRLAAAHAPRAVAEQAITLMKSRRLMNFVPQLRPCPLYPRKRPKLRRCQMALGARSDIESCGHSFANALNAFMSTRPNKDG